jgi:DNA invertase Pin-like site-specific DNA recombinase
MNTVCYVRVSTASQNLDRQLNATTEYAQDRLGAALDDIEVYRDKATGTDTAPRDAYRRLMDDVESGEVDAVVAHEVSRIARSIGDLEQMSERLREAGVELHIVSEGLTLRPGEEDPYQTALFQLLGVFVELEAKIKRQNIREGIAARQESDEYRHGPAPIGFEKRDGQLVEADDYHRVCEVLDQVSRDEMSKREAAGELDCGRKTVRRAITDNPELYGL